MEGHPVFLRLWRRGYGASWGLNFAQSWCQVLPDGYGLPPLHLDFTPDREVAKITWIGFPGPIGRFEGLFKFALIQQNFGKTSIGGARWIGQLLQRKMATASEVFPSRSWTTALRK